MTGADQDRMTAREFMRWFAANHSRGNLAAVAGSAAFSILVAVSIPLTLHLQTWATVACCAAEVAIYLASVWLVLGSRRVQEWVRNG